MLIDAEVYSLNLGRPPTVSPIYADCQFPVDEDAVVDDKGQVHPGRMFLLNVCSNIHYLVADRWRWMFSREVCHNSRSLIHFDVSDCCTGIGNHADFTTTVLQRSRT